MDFVRLHYRWIVGFFAVAILVIAYEFVLAPPKTFPSGSVVSIAKGSAAPAVAQKLANVHIVAHPGVLRIILRAVGASSTVQAGTYRFEKPQNVLTVAFRIVTGAYGLPPVRVTFFEGTTSREMGEIVSSEFPTISETDFIKAAKQYEGYLFPDTYLLPPSSDIDSIITLMRDNFSAKTATIANDIYSSGKSLSELVIIASLLEKEARTDASRRMIAGILYNRLEKGMSLQVDAVFGYIFGRDTYSPSYADLKVDSPYNTYTHRGIPPGPINNPGIDAILAAAHPTRSKYFYYLTGKDGQMRYATTYAEHQANQRKYLR